MKLIFFKQSGFSIKSIAVVLFFLAVSLSSPSIMAAEENVIYLSGERAKQALENRREKINKNPDDVSALVDAGIILHQMNRVTPSQDQVIEAERYLKKAYRANKEDYETLAWLGSTITMKAQFESDPGRQTYFVKSGTIKLDKSIRAQPDNQIIRLTRAYNSLEIPAFLKRTRFAVEDFEAYIELCKVQKCPDHEVVAAKDNLIKAKNIIASNP